jgi:molybdopterin-guanine dinucleotide biosynthesis adapter protein
VKSVSFVSASSKGAEAELIGRIVPVLKARGLRVAVVKRTPTGSETDAPGKDSRRFERAGADAVVLEGPGRIAVLKRTTDEPSFDELEKLTPNSDVVIFEGFAKAARNKIEVYRNAPGLRPLCLNDPSVLAFVSDTAFALPIPRFDINDVRGVAEFIAGKIA